MEHLHKRFKWQQCKWCELSFQPVTWIPARVEGFCQAKCMLESDVRRALRLLLDAGDNGITRPDDFAKDRFDAAMASIEKRGITVHSAFIQ